ncbi:hypothetical protein PLICRDRAFT_52006 [Plicaturopsis crispa FD-325 SS-3]|nr:hypothetical protein PLICRDRAFT_52006 [Plicaturopsis crispa FD-325 SS-3]
MTRTYSMRRTTAAPRAARNHRYAKEDRIVRWGPAHFVCNGIVDGANPELQEGTDCYILESELARDWRDQYSNEERKPAPPLVIDSLLDIARPAKPKGIAKEFEVIESVQRVVALDDAEYAMADDDEWENVCAPADSTKTTSKDRSTYSSVLRGLRWSGR